MAGLEVACVDTSEAFRHIDQWHYKTRPKIRRDTNDTQVASDGRK